MKFSACYIFQALASESENFTKYHAQNGLRNGKFHANFNLLGRGAEKITSKKNEVICMLVLQDLFRGFFVLIPSKHIIISRQKTASNDS